MAPVDRSNENRHGFRRPYAYIAAWGWGFAGRSGGWSRAGPCSGRSGSGRLRIRRRRGRCEQPVGARLELAAVVVVERLADLEQDALGRGVDPLRLPGNVRYCTTRVSPFRFVKSTYTRWLRSKLGANAIDRRPCSSPTVVTCDEMSRNGRDRSRPPCRTRMTPRRSTTYRLPPCPVTYVGSSSPDIIGCSAPRRTRVPRPPAAASTPPRSPPSHHGRHATPLVRFLSWPPPPSRRGSSRWWAISARCARPAAPSASARAGFGGGAPDALQQPRPRGGGAAGAAGRLRRLGGRRATGESLRTRSSPPLPRARG